MKVRFPHEERRRERVRLEESAAATASGTGAVDAGCTPAKREEGYELEDEFEEKSHNQNLCSETETKDQQVSAEVECADENGAVFVDFELTVVDEVHKRHVPPSFPPGATQLRKEDGACGRTLSDITPSTR